MFMFHIKTFKTNKWDTPELADFNRPTSNQASVSVSADGSILILLQG